jgi:hypothetical protein
MYLDHRRLREEQVMREIGPACACGHRSWKREPVRDPYRRKFRCTACLTVFDVSVELFEKREPGPSQQTA